MKRIVFSFFSGALFGAGLTISQMVNPRKVTDFLDFFGRWDPSLAFVMGGALAVAALGFRFILRRPHPLFVDEFHLPTARRIDAQLLGGAALFGVGWALAGYCPGTALVSLVHPSPAGVGFVVAMATGLLVGSRFEASASKNAAFKKGTATVQVPLDRVA